MRLLFLIILGFALVAPPGAALDPEVPFEQYTVRSWTRDDGLPQSSVQAILQDRQGYLWLATQEGLARFDGVRFTNFDRRSSPALPVNNVLTVLEDRQGALWIGMRGGGLARLTHGRQLQQFGEETGLTSRLVRSLSLDADGNLWVGTRGGGLLWSPAGLPVPQLRAVDGLAGARILDTLEDHSGTLWIATEGKGVCRLSDGRLRCFTAEDGLGADTAWRLLETRDGTLWIGTYGGGLARVEGDSFVRLTTRDGLPGNRVTSLLEDRDGNLWAGMAGAGLARVRDGQVTGVSHEKPLVSTTVLALAEDREGSLWVGTESEGLVRLKDSLFTALGPDEGLHSRMARCVLESRDGSLWVGTSSGGLQRFVRRHGRMVPAPEQVDIGAADVFSLYESPTGALWVGTYERGVVRLDRGRMRRWTGRDGLPAETVWALEGDGAKGTWVGTYGGGLAHITGAGINVLGTDQGMTSNLIRVLRRTPNGDLWIGTSGGGACLLRNGRILANPGTAEIAHATVFDIHAEADGALWFGTNGFGLCRLAGDEFGCLTTANGLLDDMAFRILEDDRGRFWMSCNRGVYRVPKVQLVAALEGRMVTVNCTVFGRTDGMPTGECNGGSQPCGWRGADGRLWFPTPAGFVAVEANTTPPIRPPTLVVVEAVRADGRAVSPGGAALLPAGTRTVEIDYTALTFLAPEKVGFQYQMSGLAGGWTGAGTRRTAYFNHLRPGTYRFRVRARSSLGRWGPPSAPLEVTIQPFLYQRPAFQVAIGLLLVLTFVAIGLRRANEHRRRERELELKVAAATTRLQLAHEELERANAKLRDLSLRDPLTGVSNRRRFDQALGLLWQQARRTRSSVALLMIDIDRFKAYNDHLGHLAGDACLQQVAAILTARLRRMSDLLARYGGEEFAVLLPGAEQDGAGTIAQELLSAVENAAIEHASSEHGGNLTISIGVAARVPHHDQGPEILVAAADEALYRAKAGGRNRVEFALESATRAAQQ